MSFIVVGTNHKYSSLAFREKISFSEKRVKYVLSFLRKRGLFKGVAALSTCNRVEIYGSLENPTAGVEEIKRFFSQYSEIDSRKLTDYFYVYEGKEALRHLFSVASGLNSLVLGEKQILGQVKRSFLQAETEGFTDDLLNNIFYFAISFAGLIHRKTKISKGKISVGSMAIDFIKQKIGSLKDKNILIIGVGKVSQLVLRYLKKEGPHVVFVSNRTFERAKELADRIGAETVRFDELNRFLKKADVVITATASPHFIIKKEDLSIYPEHEQSVRGQKLLIIDLALPRDVDPGVNDIKDVDLFCLEDLEIVINRNIKRKVKEAEKAQRIVDIGVEEIWDKFIRLEQEQVLWL